MFSSKGHRAIKYGAIYSIGFLVVMAGLVILLLPTLQISRLAIFALFVMSVGLGAVFGIRTGLKANT